MRLPAPFHYNKAAGHAYCSYPAEEKSKCQKMGTRKTAPGEAFVLRKKGESFKVLILSAALMAMRVRNAKRNELLGSVRALLKDSRLKAAHITDVLMQ